MWISEPVRVLDKINIDSLVEKILSLPEDVWQLDIATQQGLTRNRQVDSIYLKSISAANFSNKLATGPLHVNDVDQLAGWELLHEDITGIVDVVIGHFPPGGIVTRVQLARLNPGAEIKPHIDHSSMLIASHRLHVPLTTNNGVEFLIGGAQVAMSVGIVYEFNNRLKHSVVNHGDEGRIHLIVDYLPVDHNITAALAPSFEKRRKQHLMNIDCPPEATRFNYQLPTVIATSVIRGANKNESHGGIYLLDLSSDNIKQVVDWDNCDINWEGRGWDRGLRGIAMYGEHIYVAASDEIYCFDKFFNIISSYRNRYMKHVHEIYCYQNHLLITSTGFDSILSFNLKTKEFDKGWNIRPQQKGNLNLSLFDPRKNGPNPGNTIHINNVFQNADSMYVSGRGLPFILSVADTGIRPWSAVPLGAHNAMPYEEGVLYNDTNADLIIREEEGKICCLDVPRYSRAELKNIKLGDDKLARQAFGRGLCVYQDEIIIAGSSPSTISAYDLKSQAPIKSLNITMDIRNAIHGLEIWPH